MEEQNKDKSIKPGLQQYCCSNPEMLNLEGDVFTPRGWKIPYILTVCDNCGKIKSRSNFRDAKEKV